MRKLSKFEETNVKTMMRIGKMTREEAMRALGIGDYEGEGELHVFVGNDFKHMTVDEFAKKL